MTPSAELTALLVPGIFPVALLEAAQREGHDAGAVLAQAGVRQPLDVLRTKGFMFPEVQRVLETLAVACPQPALGLRAGLDLPLTALGPLALGMMSAATVEEAIAMAHCYWDLAGRVLQMELSFDADVCELRLATEVPFEGLLKRWALELGLVFVRQAAQVLLPGATDEWAVWFDLPKPQHEAEMVAALGPVRYDAPVTALRFPAAWLKRPLPLRSRHGWEQAVALCEAQLMAWRQPVTMKTRVQRYLQLGAEGYPSLSEVADALCVSPRTLHRRLAAEGVGFGELQAEALRRDALRLLADRRLSIADVAQRLGYEEPGNFTRAFKHLTGVNPASWRAQR